MKLNERILDDLKQAMKNQDKFKLSVMRMLKSALQLEKIQKKEELTEEEIIRVIKKNVKQRKDSIEEFKKYNKIEEINSLEKEIEILKEYLPEELTEEEIDKKIEETFNKLQPDSIKDMGRIMKSLTESIGASADMSLVSQKVKQRF